MKWQRKAGNAWNSVGGWQRMQGMTKPDGSFEMAGLYPGKYKLWLSSERGVAPDTELHTDAGTTTIRMEPAQTIKGVIVTETGEVPVLTKGQFWVYAKQNNRWFGGARRRRPESTSCTT